MFAMDPQLRRVRHADFHVPHNAPPGPPPETRLLWIEADFEFPELAGGSPSAGVPSFFPNMRMERAGQDPRVRFRLTATEDDAGDIEDGLVFVTETDDHDEPTATRTSTGTTAPRSRSTTCLPGATRPSTSLTSATRFWAGSCAPSTGAPSSRSPRTSPGSWARRSLATPPSPR